MHFSSIYQYYQILGYMIAEEKTIGDDRPTTSRHTTDQLPAAAGENHEDDNRAFVCIIDRAQS